MNKPKSRLRPHLDGCQKVEDLCSQKQVLVVSMTRPLTEFNEAANFRCPNIMYWFDIASVLQDSVWVRCSQSVLPQEQP